MIAIKVTPAQAAIATWAIDPMGDYWAEQGSDPVLPRFADPRRPSVLLLPESADTGASGVWADFLYRLEEQAEDMAEDQWDTINAPKARSVIRAARELAQKIRAATGYAGPCR